MCNSTNVNSFISSGGSITLNLKAIFLFDVDNAAPMFSVGQGNLSKCANNYCLENTFCSTLLQNVASLLGDQETSDVSISVLHPTGLEAGKFYCHTAILSGSSLALNILCTSLYVMKILQLNHGSVFQSLSLVRSSVFRAMFSNKEMVERKEGVVKMDDASVEVVEQFLTFLYTGRMKDSEGREEGSEPVWVALLPQLVYIADKVN